MVSKGKKSASSKPAASSTTNSTPAASAPVVIDSNLPVGFKTARVITLPVLVMKKAGEAHVIKINEAMRESTVKGKIVDGKQEKPATVCAVTNVQTGEQFNYLVPAVVAKNLQDGYPDNDYVGRTFYIQNLGKKKDGQRYNDFKIVEGEMT